MQARDKVHTKLLGPFGPKPNGAGEKVWKCLQPLSSDSTSLGPYSLAFRLLVLAATCQNNLAIMDPTDLNRLRTVLESQGTMLGSHQQDLQNIRQVLLVSCELPLVGYNN